MKYLICICFLLLSCTSDREPHPEELTEWITEPSYREKLSRIKSGNRLDHARLCPVSLPKKDTAIALLTKSSFLQLSASKVREMVSIEGCVELEKNLGNSSLVPYLVRGIEEPKGDFFSIVDKEIIWIVYHGMGNPILRRKRPVIVFLDMVPGKIHIQVRRSD